MRALCLILLWTLCLASFAPADNRIAAEFGGRTEDVAADREITNRQVLVDTFRDLVRYALRKTKHNVKQFGVDETGFSLSAMEKSLRSTLNAKAVGVSGLPTIGMFLAKAHEAPVTFYFEWSDPGRRERFSAEFSLSERVKPTKVLQVKLLCLGPPKKVPISPAVGEINGMKVLKEAVQESLKILPDGQLASFPHPQ